MASAYSAYAYHGHGAGEGAQHGIAALGRWSVLNKQLPAVDKIKALHVYDFDNTLFKTPTPSSSLWSAPTLGKLMSQSYFLGGGWWHDSRILAATGQGLDKEEPRAWEGWWNEKVVELVRLSARQSDALCVLLTGRGEKAFGGLIKTIVASKGLDFDLIGLKSQASPATGQAFASTMQFKQLFLTALVETYSAATEIRLYEDRPKHTRGFRDFFAEYNRRQSVLASRRPLTADVVQVLDDGSRLDPVTEVAEVQHMINQHNEMLAKDGSAGVGPRLKIHKLVLSTEYLINADDAKRLLDLAAVPPEKQTRELRRHAKSIDIWPGQCPRATLDKVGGLGGKMLWEVTGTACLDGNLWAARVRPVPASAAYHCESPVPLVVLALRRGVWPEDAARIADWQPVAPSQALVFETTVGERVILRIDDEDDTADDDGGGEGPVPAGRPAKRKYAGGGAGGRGGADDDWPAARNPASNNTAYAHYAGRNESRAFHAAGRGGGGGGGFYGYRSLDDVDGHHGPQQGYDYGDARPQQQQQQQPGYGRPRPSRGRGQHAPPPGRGHLQLPPRPDVEPRGL